jgi:hypothetical protein
VTRKHERSSLVGELPVFVLESGAVAQNKKKVATVASMAFFHRTLSRCFSFFSHPAVVYHAWEGEL